MRHVLYIGLMIIVVAVLFLALAMNGETLWLTNRLVPTAGTKVPEWIDNFRRLAIWTILGSLGSGLLWYAIGEWGARFNRWQRNYRPVWFALSIIPIALSVVGWVLTKQAIEGAIWAHLFYFANNVLTFYLGTLLFSPASVMYVPLGA